MRLFFLLLLAVVPALHAEDWQPYDSQLQQFDYSGDALREYWPLLNSAPGLPYPDQQWLTDFFEQYPAVRQLSLELAAEAGAPAALVALLQGDNAPLALAVADVWRLHYQGNFQQAYDLGMSLGPAGAIPALYSKLMYATLLVEERETRLRLFKEAAEASEKLLPLARENAFARFGLAYAHARTLEMLDTGDATSSGYLSPTQQTLYELIEEDPANAMYPAMLGGIHAGVVDRVGSFIGRMTYGSTEKRALKAFNDALKNNDQLAVIYYEYAKALGLMDADEYHDKRLELLSQCTQLTVYSAEEALNQKACSGLLVKLQQEQ